MTEKPITDIWEQRWHPLREEWVLFTSHRGRRPWIGDTHRFQGGDIPCYDPTCALCPGNKRIKGENPAYTGAYVFENDLPCFSENSPDVPGGDPLYRTRRATGTAEVVCYHPDHSKTFADLTLDQSHAVVDLWAERTLTLGSRPDVDHVLIFENKGSLVGTSNPHPHCQIYAGNMVYGITAREVESARHHFQRTGRHLGQDILHREMEGPRVIAQNASFLVCVPWFARYAYEIFILPKRSCASLTELTDAERRDLGEMMREVAIRYDNLWRMPMPYVMVIRQAPTDGADYGFFPFHLEYHPPLRLPDTMKYLAGPEVGGGSMTNESNPDEKAAELKALSNILYRSPK
ncbi:MAG: galactose-1-phosphate uridylyltransferase [Verrucomicrobiae bacterium]|nr:galactose-1-phosphate uridylyltransferase [Verrucomicrobiae bacterium]